MRRFTTEQVNTVTNYQTKYCNNIFRDGAHTILAKTERPECGGGGGCPRHEKARKGQRQLNQQNKIYNTNKNHCCETKQIKHKQRTKHSHTKNLYKNQENNTDYYTSQKTNKFNKNHQAYFTPSIIKNNTFNNRREYTMQRT